jgi:hypothetical protein
VYSSDAPTKYYLQRNPQQLPALLGKLFVFAFTWSMGGNFKRQDDMDDDSARLAMSGRPADPSAKPEIIIDIASDFDNFVRELFEVEPPLG